MVIEWLKIKVETELRETFIQLDATIWTPALASCDGFLQKEVWGDRQFPDQVVIIIHWQSREQWHSISETYLAAVTTEFDQNFPYPYKTLEAQEFEVY